MFGLALAVPLTVLQLLLLFSQTVVHAAPAPATPNVPIKQALQCVVGSFTSVATLPGVTVTIEKAVSVSDRGSYGDATDQGFPQTIDLLPALCAVTVKVTDTSDTPGKPASSYRFGMFLPASAKWNNKMLTVGSASFAGGINWPDMGQGPHYGFATISTDNGHNSNGSDLSWATPARLYDWGYRALHGSVVVGKLLVAHYYGRPLTYSYYSGCSTGGRQGLREIQYDASSFDGALIGSPAWDTVDLMPWISKMAVYQLNTTDGQLGVQQLSILAAEVLRQCDAQDGLADNVISAPEQCSFNISTIICSDPTTCLTAAQAQTAQKIWGDYTVDGKLVSNGFELGSEDQWGVYFGDTSTLQGFDFDYERYFIYNTTGYVWQQYADQAVADSRMVNPGLATANHFDISPYQTKAGIGGKGGKIMLYHGLSDGLISPKSSLLYYQQTMAAMGITNMDDMRSWFRFFEVPGMQHCWFSNRYNAPWDFASSGQATQLRLLPYLGVGLPAVGDGWSVPGHLNDSNYDALAALQQWVEDDKPVDQVIATAFNSDFSANRTRPICPYPQKATYNGSGDVNNASSWGCA
ncbi:Tannase/feruloyl esterase [Diplogelasinospora grovesii]|uniref:Carboxylic ester hydrolase n=1 Tax=Diplogelasinospora grovesii TaxID=303347 RepID=A0AAN6N7E2_9PEZI|nr:Tannase/feruloyl esterase [Diplogelasinospora grovesii]